MAKRYHQSKRDRMREERGEERYLRGPVRIDEQVYEGGHILDSRRGMENSDYGMISEDHNAIANLPQGVKYTEWPKGGRYTPEGLDDTIRGINRQMDQDGDRMYSGMKPRKA